MARCSCSRASTIVALVLAPFCLSGAALADPLLDETVNFTGQILFLEHKVPALVIGAVRNGEVSIQGFGERSEGGAAPDGDTLLRIGSITKAFTGEVLAHLVAEDTVAFADTFTTLAPEIAPNASKDIQLIRLIDLVTHSAGLPREVPHQPGPENNPFATVTREAFANWLKTDSLLFAPGTGVLYSNFGFDLLAIALSNAAKTPYPQLLEQYIARPIGVRDTTFTPTDAQKARVMQGHGFDGTPIPDVPTGSVIVGSGGLYSTPKDLLRWMQWHLDRSGGKGTEARLLDHAIYLVRDGLNPVYGMDESGHMDAMGLAWIAMMPKEDRPFILQKAGGLQGVFTYIAFAPAHGVAVFVAINKFDFNAAMAMAAAANELIANLAPR
jgi:D-alanyl-D-alanine-carboxypeptidase/D-alanyl-D-alanine-endopeptidase